MLTPKLVASQKYALNAAATPSSVPALSPRGPPLPPHSPHSNGPLGAPSSLPVSPLPTAGILSSSPHGAPAPGSGSVPGLDGLANQIAPMRRGRPGKTPGGAADAAAAPVPERQVRTGLAEWHQGGERAGERSGMDWDGFGAPGGSGGATGAEAGGAAGQGFGDAFAPAAGTKVDGSATANAALKTSVEMPRNAGMFAALAGQNGAGSPMAVDGPAVGAKEGANEDDSERLRFEQTFPAIEFDSAFEPTPKEQDKAHAGNEESMSAAPPASATLIDADSSPAAVPAPATAPSAAQLTGEQPSSASGPPLPRRPPTASPSLPPAPAPKPEPHRQVTKPGLVSRGSQTSPHLMASWRPAQNAPSPGAGVGASVATPPQQQSTLRQSSIPELALEGADGPAGQAKPVVDLLGDDDAPSFESLAPALRATPSPTPQAASSSPSETFASKRATFLGAQAPSTSGGGLEREKFRPVTKRMSLSPAGSPKPVLAPAPAAPPKPEPEREQSVEERFPALTLDEPTPQGVNGRGSEFEQVVEKEQEDGDSSDDEQQRGAPPVSAAKVAAPAFDDDDDFAPRKPAPSTATGAKPLSDAKVTTASPPPLERQASTHSAVVGDAAQPSRQLSTASSTSNGDGGMDLGPALASIRKFAPQGNGQAPPSSLVDEQDDFAPLSPPAKPMSPPAAPLVAPKPQSTGRKQAINSLVSRYEGLGSALTGGPPPVGVKPVGLRKDSTGSSTGSGAAHALHTREGVRPQRLPQWGAGPSGGLDGVKSPVGSVHSVQSVREVPEDNPTKSPTVTSPQLPPKPSTPTFAPAGAPSSGRPPFKPTPPPGSPSSPAATTTYARPAFGTHTSRPSFGTRAPPAASQAQAQPPVAAASASTEGDEERFAGVSNMKSRWESMNRAQDPPQQPRAGGAAQGKAAAKRRSWAQI